MARESAKFEWTSSRHELAEFLGVDETVPSSVVTRFARDFDHDVTGGEALRSVLSSPSASPRRRSRGERERGERRAAKPIRGRKTGAFLKFIAFLGVLAGILSFFLPYVWANASNAMLWLIPQLASIALFFGFRFLRRVENPQYPVFAAAVVGILVIMIAIWNFSAGFDASRLDQWYQSGVINGAQNSDTGGKMVIPRMVMIGLTIATSMVSMTKSRGRFFGFVGVVVSVAGLRLYDWIFSDYLLDLEGILAGGWAFPLWGIVVLIGGIAAMEILYIIFARFYYRYHYFGEDDDDDMIFED